MADKPEKDTDTFLAIYEGGNGQIELRFDGDRETIWATQAQMAELFKVDRSGITKHINDIFESGELEELSNVQKMHISSTKPTMPHRPTNRAQNLTEQVTYCVLCHLA